MNVICRWNKGKGIIHNSAFLSSILWENVNAHELRTLLSVICGRLERIVDGIYSENRSQVSMALEQTYVLERLVEDWRQLTLAETRQLAFDKTDVNMAAFIDRVLEMLSAEAEEKKVSLSFIEKSGNLKPLCSR